MKKKDFWRRDKFFSRRNLAVFFLLIFFSAIHTGWAQNYKFDFTGNRRAKDGYVKVTPDLLYGSGMAYGYDLVEYGDCFFSVALPDGNYRVTVTFGSKRKASSTTFRAEARRLLAENVQTKKGQYITRSYTLRVNSGVVSEDDSTPVEIRANTLGLDWDDKLTLEFGGAKHAVAYVTIERVDEVPVLWLCGNSTVVDQDFEPWASWGQMVTRWFDDGIAVANYAASGWSVATLLRSARYKKLLHQLKKGDVVLVEYGHNDQKQKGPGKGAYYHFATGLKQIADEVRLRGGYIVFVTPTQRRSFDNEGRINETHGEYPDAMRWVAEREEIPVIELHDMTRTFFETLGVEGSKRSLVHFPAFTFPGQEQALEDNTHFNDYGAYEVAKMVLSGMKQLEIPCGAHILSDYAPFNPAHPDNPVIFEKTWVLTPMFGIEKPAGN